MSTFGNSFVKSFNPAFQQSAAAAAEASQLKLRKAMEEQAAQTARERAIAEEGAQYGVAPVVGPDGKVNLLATVASVQKARDMHERLKAQTRMKDGYDMELGAKARSLGINAGETGIPIEQAIRERENRGRIDQAAAESEARAKATAGYENRFAQGDNLAKNGQFVGRAVRDQRTGEYGIMQDGKITPIPEGAEPMTPTAMQKNIPALSEFRKIKGDLTDSERSLRQIEQYAGTVGGLQQGIAGLADKFTSGVKTLLGTGKLSKSELDRRLAEGNLQGLLGGNRTAVVGGGVMTEQDAQRIIDYLGGDVGAWQNKEQVMQALSQLYRDRYAQYENDVQFYNAAVDDYYGSKGFKRQQFTDYNSLFGQPAVNGAVPAAAPAQPAAQPTQSDLKARAMEELARRRGKQ